MTWITRLQDRGVIGIAGDDRVAFLNGLVSNDVAKAAPGCAVWAALLTPQGRYLADFFVSADERQLWLDTERSGAPDLLRRLNRFRLRSKVELRDESESLAVYAAWGGPAPDAAVAAPDPRLAEAGYRVLSAASLPETASAAAYDAHRLSLGLPDGTRDLEPGKTLLLEAGFDELNGIAWDKGCYMGQELTARTKYRGLVKRRLVPVALNGPATPPGTPVLAEGQEVGVLRSTSGQAGLAMLRLDALEKPLTAGSAALSPRVPDWMKLRA